LIAGLEIRASVPLRYRGSCEPAHGMTSTRITLVSRLLPLVLGGCALKLPSAAPQAELPAAWKNAAGFPVASPSKDLARWWRKFDDPVLNRLIADGLANSPDLATAAARVREARARGNEAAAELFPSVTGSASTESGVVKPVGGRRVSETRYSAGLDASWEADLFGKNRSKIAAAAAEIGAAGENQHSVQAALASEIAAAHTRLRAYETGLVILRRIVTTREETSRLATWRRQAGEADSLEAAQALSSLEQARAAVPALEQSAAQTRNLLALLCGRQPGSLDGMLSSGNPAIPTPRRGLAIGIPADTIRQRPDVRLAGYQLAAAMANTRAAEAERFPSLALTGSLGIDSLSAGKFFDPQTASASLITGLTGPVFDAGRIRSNIEARGAAQDQAVQTYRAAVLTALSEVEDALIACRRSGERLATLEKAAAAAREAAQLAQQRYEAGVTDLLTVLDAQRTLLGLEDGLLTVRGDHTTAYIQLYKALGGGWS
jgi:NodT family efflux transporter outer membrane factor (OMF) lipoprotein